jgi:DNA-binding PadR family transcriptional regulator
MPTRQQWLMLLLGADGGPFDVDQVRAMKGMFLLSRRPGHPASALYRFDQSDYGPFDFNVYRDLDALRIDGLVHAESIPGSSRRLYRLTDAGCEQFDSLVEQVAPDELAAVAEVKRHVTALTFRSLLSDIYARFPEFRERSMTPEARIPA